MARDLQIAQGNSGRFGMADKERRADDRRQTLYRGKFLEIVAVSGWEFAVRVGEPGVVGIVAVTPADELVLISQLRVPVGRRVIEIPGGLVGDGCEKGETWEQAAIRELEEETGWVAGRMEKLTGGPSSAGMTSECVLFVRAMDLRSGGVRKTDGEEKITVHQVKMAEVDAWLRGQEAAGVMVDPRVWAGLYFLGRKA
jgi:ADP-ribose pyrophosphatase